MAAFIMNMEDGGNLFRPIIHESLVCPECKQDHFAIYSAWARKLECPHCRGTFKIAYERRSARTKRVVKK